jgi:hypothetical protein
MKNMYLFFSGILFLLFSISGCEKSGDENTNTIPDARDPYLGNWQGVVTDSSKSTQDTLTLALVMQTDNNLAEGYVTFRHNVYKIIEKTFGTGFFSFSVINYDPNCTSYSLSFIISLDNSGKLIISFKGYYCNGLGINVSGTIVKTGGVADLSHIITFARTGHIWTWRVTQFDGGTCSFTYTMGKDFGNGVYKFNMSTDCAWQTFGPIGYWYATPQEWADMTDSIPAHRYTNFRTDAKVGTVYMTVNGQDSVINTVESLDDLVSIDNQSYHCIRIHTYQFHSPSYRANGLCWCNYQYGFIKFENLDTSGPTTAVHYEELIAKNY